jgi:hypothetical protein
MVKAEDALAEINNATFGVLAAKGQKLSKLIDGIKGSVIDSISKSGIAGGGAGDANVNQEVYNAIASVDFEIEDGLKLDYRIRQIQEKAQVSDKDFIMPFKYETVSSLTSNSITITPEDGTEFVAGDVTVLDSTGERGILGSNNALILGRIDDKGVITLDEAPNQPVKLYYPVRLKFKDVPEDFVYTLIQTMVSKTSPLMEMILKFEILLSSISNDIQAMKGQDWTADFSIMRNQQDIVKESITPKGLMLQVQDGMVHATFSYSDHPYLDHFELEKWNEETGTWENPIIIPK